jgi:hypothetical protein
MSLVELEFRPVGSIYWSVADFQTIGAVAASADAIFLFRRRFSCCVGTVRE